MLAGSVASAGAGAQSDDADDADELDPDPLPDDVTAVLDPLPTAVGDDGPETFVLSRPTEESSATHFGRGASAEVFGLEPSDVDRIATTTYGDYDQRLIVASGSFDEDDVDPTSAGPTIGEPAADVSDGVAVLALGSEDGWSDGLDAATDAAGDTDAGVLDEYSMAALLEPLVDKRAVTVADVEGADIEEHVEADVDLDDVEVVAVGEEQADLTTLQLSFVVLFDSAETVDEAAARAIVESAGLDQDVEDDELDTVGRRTVATVQRPVPEHRLPDDSPDVHFRFEYVGDGTVEIEAIGEEAAEPANLQLLVDGEPVEDPPWADRDEPIEPGTTFEVAADLFSVLGVEWNDPQREGVSHSLGETMLGAHRELFTEQYDHDASELTITYEGPEPVDAGRLELLQRGPDQHYDEPEPESLEERVDRLTSGTEIVLEDVTYGDTVSIRATAEHETSSYLRSVYHYRARAPGAFEFTHEDGVPTLVYRGREPQPAENYRMTVPQRGGRRGTARDVPLDVQWEDEYETVSPGDTLALGDVEVGTYCRVEWTGTDEPVHVDSFRVEPDVEFSTTYDEAANAVEFAHDGGQALDADRLSVTVYVRGDREEYDVFDESEQVTEGDSTTLELPGDPDDEDADRHRAFLVVEYGNGMPIHFTNVDRSGSSAESDA